MNGIVSSSELYMPGTDYCIHLRDMNDNCFRRRACTMVLITIIPICAVRVRVRVQVGTVNISYTTPMNEQFHLRQHA